MDEVRKQLMTEFDYQNEARSLRDVRATMENSEYSKHIKIPEPVDTLYSQNLLVMEMLNGKKIFTKQRQILEQATLLLFDYKIK